MNRIDLQGRTAVVTGGAKGIGAAIAERFRASGARVAVWDLEPPPPTEGGLFVAADVADAVTIDAARERTLGARAGSTVRAESASADPTSGTTISRTYPRGAVLCPCRSRAPLHRGTERLSETTNAERTRASSFRPCRRAGARRNAGRTRESPKRQRFGV
jgi:NAD(P)-dependent dehydrogenase (short-subunit alcohol dehydrogenase family)